MSRIAVTVRLENLFDLYRAQRGQISDGEVRRVEAQEAFIDTGLAHLYAPAWLIDRLGLMRQQTRPRPTPTGVRLATAYGPVRFTIQGRDDSSEVIEVADDNPVVFGHIALTALDFVVDPDRQVLTGNPAHGGERMGEEY